MSSIDVLAADLLQQFAKNHLKLVVAESCTGGMLAGAITSVAGSSEIFDRGFVTYSNEAKVQMLGVDPDLIANQGAVSSEVAIAMAKGALKLSLADYAIAVTGIAGPGGGSAFKPVGLVYIAFASENESLFLECRFKGSRAEIREASIKEALQGVLEFVDSGLGI